MSNRKNCLSNLVEINCGKVIFGDSVKFDIMGYDELNKIGIPRLPKLYYGLTSNLTSISWLCGKNFWINFTKDECLVFDNTNKQVIEGIRSSNNCYLSKGASCKAKLTEEDLFKLWHDKLGHINPQMLVKLSRLGELWEDFPT